MKLEVIMSAYNNPRTLSIVLDGYLEQSDRDFYISVADDGSTAEVKSVCDAYRIKGLRITHIWHEDNGFRRAAIMNKAILNSKAEYIVMTDSDCIPHRCFIADHKEKAEINRLVIGRRVDLKQRITNNFILGILNATIVSSASFLIFHGLLGDLKRAEFGIRYPEFIANRINTKERAALGANMAAWKEDLLRVNGFDNDFVGYGLEESDLEQRLNKVGIINKSIIGRAILVHLHHPERNFSPDNAFLLLKKKNEHTTTVRNGIYDLRTHQSISHLFALQWKQNNSRNSQIVHK